MGVGADHHEQLVRLGVEYGRRHFPMWKALLLADGRPPGTARASQEERLLQLARMAPRIPEIAATDPEQAARLIKEIDGALNSGS